MDTFNTILDAVRAQDKPNYTQAEMALQEVALMLEANGFVGVDQQKIRIAYVLALRALREHMEQKYQLLSFTPLLLKPVLE